MAIFRHSKRPTRRASSPRELFDQLPPSKSVEFLWDHQGKVLDQYLTVSQKKDVAVELPTGAGKTLVGALIAEFKRQQNDSRVVYLCPTRQLAFQTHAKLMVYGIDAACLVGSKKEFDQVSLTAYERGSAIAITTYSSIFNVKPGIENPQVIICDDAHAGESFVVSMWSLEIDSEDDAATFQTLMGFFGDAIRPELRNLVGSSRLRDVDLVPLPRYALRLEELTDLLNDQCMRSESLRYQWMAIKGHLAACNVYVSPSSFLIRPLIPPTAEHATFAGADHRVYMSATLGENGDLERMFGVRNMSRISVSERSEANTGRRFILFQSLLQPDARAYTLARALDSDERVVVITSGGSQVTRRTRKLLKSNKFDVLDAKHIEEDLSPFTSATNVALLLSNRYDGIDLPGDQCRRMMIVGVPRALNLQEQFLQDRLGAYAVMRNRVRVRLTQAVGRCTRHKNDYAFVLCLDSELKSWCTPSTNREGLSPELQAELEFGLDQSEGDDKGGMDEETAEAALDAFFDQTVEWQDDADFWIRERAKELKRVPSDVSGSLANSAQDEMGYVYALWREDFQTAHGHAVKVVDALNGIALKPYRAFWEYLAAIAADGAHRMSKAEHWALSFQQHVQSAANVTGGVRWLASLKFAHPKIELPAGVPMSAEGVCDLLEEWGLRGPAFAKKLESVKKDISSKDADAFHRGLEALGQMLGFEAKLYKANGAPDCLWYSEDGHFYVFEAKSNEEADAGVSFKTLRQAGAHPEWLEAHDKALPVPRRVEVIVVTPRTTLDKTAAPLAKQIKYLKLDEVAKLFEETAALLTRVRAKARAMNEEQLREHVLDEYRHAGLCGDELKKRVVGRLVTALPIG